VSLTSTVRFDSANDGTYEIDATSKVISGPTIALGPGQGTCSLVLNNSAGTYSPRGAGTPIRPLMGVQVISESQNIYHGFVRRVFQDPRMPGTLTVECNDWMWVLSRIDVSLPMMRNVRSDILAHRIADLAEIGELVGEPRFLEALVNWTATTNATVTRVTTDPILEGLNALKVAVTATAADRGANYDYPTLSAVQGKTIIASVYIRSETATGVGAPMEVKLVEAGAGSGTTTQTATLSEDWERVQVSRAINAAATDLDLQVVVDSANSSAFDFHVGAAHAVTSLNDIPRTFAVAGSSRFEYVAPRRVKAGDALRDVAASELGGLIYVDESGNLTFDTHTHRWGQSASITSQTTIDETMVALTLEEDAEDLVGEVEIGYSKWEIGTASSVVFGLFPVPRAIAPSGSITFDIDYGALVRDHITPVANTDYFIRSSPDGDTAGADESGNVTLAFQDFGEGARVTLTNTVARAVHLTNFQVRGTPVRISSDTAQETYTPSGAPASASKLSYRYDLLSSGAAAETWAQYLGDRYVTQRERIPVTLVNRTAALLTQQTTRKISDRVTITNNNSDRSTKLNGDYYIDSIRQEFGFGAMSLRTVWECVPVDALFWSLGTGELDDAQTLTTTTALAP